MTTSGPGRALLLEVRDRLTVERFRDVVAPFGEDGATVALHSVTGGTVDLADAAHRRALLAWLRAWGCRHLRVADSRRSSAALARWWRRWAPSLPPESLSIDRLDEPALSAVAELYAALASLRVAGRAAATGEVDVSFGDTAAAKALFALRPFALPPWDEPIRLAFGVARGDGTGYAAYVEACGDALVGAARRSGVAVGDLPSLLARPSSTPPKVIDEYLWMRVTRARRDGRAGP